MRLIKIEVTAADIREGKARDPYGCPLALAIARHPQLRVSDVAVWLAYLYVTVDQDRLPIKTTTAMSRFIRRYDRAKKACHPQNFQLRVPLEAVR